MGTSPGKCSQHLYFSLNELPRSPGGSCHTRITPDSQHWAMSPLTTAWRRIWLLNAQKHKVARYSEEGILDVKRNTEHKIQSNIETTRLVERRRECSQQVQCLFQHFVVQHTFKEPKLGLGVVRKMLHVFNQNFYDKAAWWSLGNDEVWKQWNLLQAFGAMAVPARWAIKEPSLFIALERVAPATTATQEILLCINFSRVLSPGGFHRSFGGAIWVGSILGSPGLPGCSLCH